MAKTHESALFPDFHPVSAPEWHPGRKSPPALRVNGVLSLLEGRPNRECENWLAARKEQTPSRGARK